MLSLTLSSSYAIGSGEASLAIGNAEKALEKAFAGVLEAERAGGNVSHLIARLDEAGRLLAEAENAYRVGNFSEAVSRAEGCSLLANGAVGEALSLRNTALANAQMALWQNLTFSYFGGLAFLAALFSAWWWFKRAYARKLLKMKLEVAVDAED